MRIPQRLPERIYRSFNQKNLFGRHGRKWEGGIRLNLTNVCRSDSRG
jgi:hypothetical protein